VTETNRRRGSGTREKVSSRRINLEYNTFYMEAMLGVSLYSYLYLNKQKCFVPCIIVYTLSSTKLEIRSEQPLPRSEGVQGEREGASERGRGWGQGEK
jgi:hypothetical protein